MSPDDRDALDALHRRLGHIRGTARLIGEHGQLTPDTVDAVNVIASALEEAWDQLDSILTSEKARPA